MDFSGLVLFHDLEGRFVNGWRFTEGKVTHTVDNKGTVLFQKRTVPS